MVILIVASIFVLVYLVYITPFRNGLRKQRHRDFKGAEADYTAMLRRKPDFWQASNHRAQVRFLRGDIEGTFEDVNRTIYLNPHFPGIYLVRGDLHLARGDSSLAAQDYQHALSLRPKPVQKAYGYLKLGNLKLKDYGESRNMSAAVRSQLLDEALGYYEKALQEKLSQVTSLALSGKAQIFRFRSDFQAALQIYEAGLRSLPYSPMLLTDRASLYIVQGNLDVAIADCDKAIYLSGGKIAIAYNNRGYAHALRGDLEQALADCNRALEMSPRYYYAYGSRAYTYFLMGNFDAALADFQAALDIKPDHDYALAGKAIALYRLDRVDEAKAVWRSLLELDPAYTDPDQLRREYYSPDSFVAEARKITALLSE